MKLVSIAVARTIASSQIHKGCLHPLLWRAIALKEIALLRTISLSQTSNRTVLIAVARTIASSQIHKVCLHPLLWRAIALKEIALLRTVPPPLWAVVAMLHLLLYALQPVGVCHTVSPTIPHQRFSFVFVSESKPIANRENC